jgi:apolipoprotein N-acyltransferase
MFNYNLSLRAQLIFAFLSGLCGAFAFAPYYIFPLFIISFCSLIYLLFRTSSYKESFLIGWVFGFGYFLAGLYWIAYPLIFYYFSSFWWLIPFAIIFIPSILALYHGICASILYKFNNGNPVIFSIYFLCLWIVFEVMRNALFTGFPWLLAGYSLATRIELIQSASWFGVFGLSFVSLSMPAACFLALNSQLNNGWTKVRIIICAVLIGIFCTSFLYGWNRLNTADIKLSPYKKVKIIQPNINELLTRETMDRNADKIINLAKLNPLEDKGLLYVLFPEGALNHLPKAKLMQLIQQSVPPYGYLIGGGDRVDYARRLAWNSVFVIDHSGNVIDVYDKTHLVPFGEYVPFRKELSAKFNAVVSNFTNDFIDFSKGSGPRTIVPEANFSFTPSICYESLFARDAINKINPPHILINFTTDMWYKNSSGPYQHFDMSRLRAVEYGIPLIRVASTGISGVVDPYGRVIAQLALNEAGIISSYIPLAMQSKSFYLTYGDAPILLFLAAILLCNYLISKRKT